MLPSYFKIKIFDQMYRLLNTGTQRDIESLLFIQVVRGVKFGEYRCERDEDLAMVAAQQYYIEYGTDLNQDRFMTNLTTYIPDYCVSSGEKTIERWLPRPTIISTIGGDTSQF